jgi:Raf kinase inhibitor-like YbhB/YbcL family protein
MIITSPSFPDSGEIPKKFTCDGGGINPELEIQNVPLEAKSLALILHDPDAPVAGGFYHWVVWDINPRTMLIKEESVPSGSIEGNNSSDELGWVAPCPPAGPAHHYEFHLYALDSTLNLSKGSTAVKLQDAMNGRILAKASLVGLYQRE